MRSAIRNLWKPRLWRYLACILVAGLVVSSLEAGSATADVTVPTTFSYVSGAPTQQYTVPAGITQVTITADGGSGAPALGGVVSQPGGVGGAGGEVTATVAVIPAATLSVVVGGDGGAAGSSCTVGGTACGGPGRPGRGLGQSGRRRRRRRRQRG